MLPQPLIRATPLLDPSLECRLGWLSQQLPESRCLCAGFQLNKVATSLPLQTAAWDLKDLVVEYSHRPT